jgi:urease accessory protein
MSLFQEHWSALNNRLSAMKPARESRTASATLGRRFLRLVHELEEHPLLHYALQATKGGGENHYSIAFGLVGAILDISEDATVLAHLQQSLLGLVSACQRLLPLGQQQASTILWRLKPTLIAVAQRSEEEANDPDAITIFTPLADIGSMRHPSLATRLFIS